MLPILNWKELEYYMKSLAPRLEGRYVEKIQVPARPYHRDGYLKNEFVFRLHRPGEETHLVLSARPHFMFLKWGPQKGPKFAQTSTLSVFGLQTQKHLSASRIVAVHSLHQERMACLWFQLSENVAEEVKAKYICVLLCLIPAHPEALLLPSDSVWTEMPASPVPVLARTRVNAGPTFSLPSGKRPDASPPVRLEWVGKDGALGEVIDDALRAESFESMRLEADRFVRERLKILLRNEKDSQGAIAQALSEKNWTQFADLLKYSIHLKPKPFKDTQNKDWVEVPDYSKEGIPLLIPFDTRYTLTDLIQRYYSLAKRRDKRLCEAEKRIDALQKEKLKLQSILANLQVATAEGYFRENWETLIELRKKLGLVLIADKGQKELLKKRAGFSGKIFQSREGLSILVGRDKDENAELTFRVARGNDLWFHVKGRPGSHAVIQIPSKKTASLESLLDAALLVLFYSGGKEWGKTEVDYTYKKHVKRIKDSVEVSYTQNKTLIIEFDQGRMDRLFANGAV